jgi:AraC-like DNA-binding protein
MAVLCDTGDVDARDRFDLWQQSLVTSFFPVRVERLERSTFNARLEGHSLGPLRVFHADAAGCAPVRTPRCIAAGDPEQLQLHLLRRGHCQVTQQGRSCETTAGDITLMASSQPSTIRARGAHDLLIFSLPLRLLGPHADRLSRWTAVRVPGDRGLAARVGPFLGSIADGLEDGSVREDDVALADAVLALTRALYSSPAPGAAVAPQSSGEGLLARVKCYIDGHLHEPDLRPETIAAAHFVSVRYLHKLFEAEEMTLCRWMQRRRLDRCCDDLRDHTLAGQSIAAIAARWGFRNRDVFTRLVRISCGMTPQEIRAQAARASADATSARAPRTAQATPREQRGACACTTPPCTCGSSSQD